MKRRTKKPTSWQKPGWGYHVARCLFVARRFFYVCFFVGSKSATVLQLLAETKRSHLAVLDTLVTARQLWNGPFGGSDFFVFFSSSWWDVVDFMVCRGICSKALSRSTLR